MIAAIKNLLGIKSGAPAGDGDLAALYQKLRDADDVDTRSKLASEIAARDYGLLRLVEQMPYAIEIAYLGSQAQSDGPDLHHFCGIVALTQGDYVAAQRFLEQAMAEGPVDARLFNTLGVLQRMRGNTAGAVVAFNRALATDQNCTIAQMNLSSTRYGLHQPLLRLDRR